MVKTKTEQSKAESRRKIKGAKRLFVRTMLKKYKGFTEKQWAKTGYREANPQ